MLLHIPYKANMRHRAQSSVVKLRHPGRGAPQSPSCAAAIGFSTHGLPFRVERRLRPTPVPAKSIATGRSSTGDQQHASNAAPTAPCLPQPAPADARSALAVFLRRRRWLRPSPEAPLQLVHVPVPPWAQRAAAPGVGDDTTQAATAQDSGANTNNNRNSSSIHEGVGPGGHPAAGYGSGPSGVGRGTASFYLLRDDLLHPVLGGNKVRKLDALVPELQQEGATDLVTCGGLQSAHLAAVAVVAAEAGLRSHLLVRGERPQMPVGYHLVTRMYGTDVSYVSRAEYADRHTMLSARAAAVRGGRPGAQVAVVSEGGGDPPALLGLIRLVHWLAYGSEQDADAGGGGRGGAASLRDGAAVAPVAAGASTAPSAPRRRISAVLRGLPYANTTPYTIVVDSGTGTTAVGVALGIALLGLPWSVHAVMLAGDLSYYRSQEEALVHGFLERYGKELYGLYGCDAGGARPPAGASGSRDEAAGGAPVPMRPSVGDAPGGMAPLPSAPSQPQSALPFPLRALPLRWLPRPMPRRFGKVLPGEIAECKRVAQLYGVALDPIYSLAAWEVASREVASREVAERGDDEDDTAAAVSAAREATQGVDAGQDAVAAATAGPREHQSAPGVDRSSPQDRSGNNLPGAAGRGGGGGDGGYNGGTGGCAVDHDPRVGSSCSGSEGDPPPPGVSRVVMLHGGGALGLHGLAQRYPAAF